MNFFAPRSQEERNDILLKPDSNTGYDVSGLTFPLGLKIKRAFSGLIHILMLICYQLYRK